jgi:hypothetical protein
MKMKMRIEIRIEIQRCKDRKGINFGNAKI